jgi:hypothetical protein
LDLKLICVIFALISFLITVLGAKIKKSLGKDFIIGLAASFFFASLTAIFTDNLAQILIVSVWILPLIMADHFKITHSLIYKSLIVIGVVDLLLLCSLTVIYYIILVISNPLLIMPSILIFIFFLMIVFVNKYVFAPFKKIHVKELREQIIKEIIPF